MAELLAPLIGQMRQALAADGIGETPVEFSRLIGAIRSAIEADRGFHFEDDLKLASAMRDLLPRVTEMASEAHEQIRQRLSADAPWSLVALDSPLDLLSPLGKELNELTHTKVLGFLLDPAQTHGLGIRVLRELFKLMGRCIPGEDMFERLAKDSAQGTETLRRMRVTTEHRHDMPGRSARCDLWLELDDDERSLIVVVENKITAAEHGDQLRVYEEALWRRAKERRRLSFEAKLVFLTPDGRLPDQDYDQRLWLPLSYTHLAACLAHASRDAPEPGKTFLNLYNSTILRAVLNITSESEGLEKLHQLSFLHELEKQGVTS
jgi:hypothetical protein